MPAYDFGQPQNGVIQMAYTVADIHEAMHYWIKNLRTGPWFYAPSMDGIDPQYRGNQSVARQAVAMAFSGSMLIELIQPLDDEPSVFREIIEKRGYGFHHVGLATHDLDGDVAGHVKDGHALAFITGVPTGGKVAYIDTGRDHFVELIGMDKITEAIFTSFYRASLDWDGSDPIRPFG